MLIAHRLLGLSSRPSWQLVPLMYDRTTVCLAPEARSSHAGSRSEHQYVMNLR